MNHVIRAAALRGYQDVMHELGVSPTRLLEQFELNEALLSDDDALLPMVSVCGLLEASSIATQCGDLGLRIAQHQDVSVLGILGLVLKTASTPAQACDIISRFTFIQGTALRIEVQDPGNIIPDSISINISVDGVAAPIQRQVLELILGMSFQIGKMRSPFGQNVVAVSVPHSLGALATRHRQFFGIPVLENQLYAALHFDVAGWNTPVEDADPHVNQMLKDHLERNFPVPMQSYTNRVRVALRPLIGTPQANREDVARILAIHPRTLHRRLHAENISFQDIKDTIRKELALKYLTETNASLTQLSSLLGFPEQSALSRACKKWFDLSPNAIRKGLRSAL